MSCGRHASLTTDLKGGGGGGGGTIVQMPQTYDRTLPVGEGECGVQELWIVTMVTAVCEVKYATSE